MPALKPSRLLNSELLKGVKLKIKRAKGHIAEFQALAEAHRDSNPYEIVHELDPQTGENVYRVLVKKKVPDDAPAIIGDAIHNLRSALDYLVGDLARDNNETPHQNYGLPVSKNPERLKPGTIHKLKGVSTRAERLILRLKACDTLHVGLWTLHWLDIIDKHNSIIIVAAATITVNAKVGVPGMFLGPEGHVRLLGPGPDGVPFLMDAGTPVGFKRVFPLNDSVEIHRSPAGFQEEIEVIIDIALGESEIPEGQPVLETLNKLVNLVERIVGIFERHVLKQPAKSSE